MFIATWTQGNYKICSFILALCKREKWRRKIYDTDLFSFLPNPWRNAQNSRQNEAMLEHSLFWLLFRFLVLFSILKFCTLIRSSLILFSIVIVSITTIDRTLSMKILPVLIMCYDGLRLMTVVRDMFMKNYVTLLLEKRWLHFVKIVVISGISVFFCFFCPFHLRLHFVNFSVLIFIYSFLLTYGDCCVYFILWRFTFLMGIVFLHFPLECYLIML